MRRSIRSLVLLLPCAAVLSLTGEARAVDVVDLGGEPLTVDVTNTATFNWHFDNRNDDASSPGSSKPTTLVDDHYGEVLDRLNLQLNWWRITAAARIDTATYLGVTSPAEAKALGDAAYDDLVSKLPPNTPLSRNDVTTAYYRELHNRYLSTYYPSKLWVGYTQPGLDATVGDFYAQLGRGLVLSVRKIDEVAIDTTIRGGKLVLDHSFGSFRAGATLLGGQLNPLRIDEPSGRRLQGDGSPLFFGFPRIGDFRYYKEDVATRCPGIAAEQKCFVEAVDVGRPNYLEDTVLGGRVEAGTRDVLVAANGALLLRKDRADSGLEFSPNDPSRAHSTIRTFSGSVSLPSIAKSGDLYVEVAGQQLRDGKATEPNLSGYAVYAAANAHAGALSLSLEGKHYRTFFPLAANIDITDPTFGAPEFSVVSYNSVPTVEPVYVEQIGSPNVCITGGWGRADYKFSKAVSTFGWLGRYASYTESSPGNYECDTADANRTDTWDSAAGADVHLEGDRTHGKAWVGARVTDRAEPFDSPSAFTDAFYHEGYIRYDLVKHISGPFSLQFQGFHRHRWEPTLQTEAWNEGENYTALQWSPHVTAIFGYEYLGKAGCGSDRDVRLCHYVSGALQWRSASSKTALDRIFDTVQLYVGQRRGAVRCVSGVCRQFPPFEGAKIEVVSRF